MSPEDSKELTPVQQLLRLKRYEKPAEDFVEEFVSTFHERQRAELLRQSARGLLWERATTYWENFAAPKWSFAAAAAVALLAGAWWLLPEKEGHLAKPQFVNYQEGSNFSNIGGGFQVEGMIWATDPHEQQSAPPVTDDSLLLSRHFSGGYADDARYIKTSK